MRDDCEECFALGADVCPECSWALWLLDQDVEGVGTYGY